MNWKGWFPLQHSGCSGCLRGGQASQAASFLSKVCPWASSWHFWLLWGKRVRVFIRLQLEPWASRVCLELCICQLLHLTPSQHWLGLPIFKNKNKVACYAACFFWKKQASSLGLRHSGSISLKLSWVNLWMRDQRAASLSLYYWAFEARVFFVLFFLQAAVLLSTFSLHICWEAFGLLLFFWCMCISLDCWLFLL